MSEFSISVIWANVAGLASFATSNTVFPGAVSVGVGIGIASAASIFIFSAANKKMTKGKGQETPQFRYDYRRQKLYPM